MPGAAARSFLISAAAFALATAGCRQHDDHRAPPAPAAADPAAKALAREARQQAACDVVIAAVADGTWVGTSGGAHRFVARCGREPDTRAASRELQSFLLAARPECEPTVDVGGGPGAEFYDLIAAMDAARMAGFEHIGMSGANDLVTTFPAAPGAGDRAPPDCLPDATAPDARPASAPVPLQGSKVTGDALGENDASRVVVVSVETETISVNGKPAAAIGASTLGLIPELARALPPPTADPIVIVTGDRHLGAAIVARVVRTLAASGYKDVRFSLAPH